MHYHSSSSNFIYIPSLLPFKTLTWTHLSIQFRSLRFLHLPSGTGVNPSKGQSQVIPCTSHQFFTGPQGKTKKITLIFTNTSNVPVSQRKASVHGEKALLPKRQYVTSRQWERVEPTQRHSGFESNLRASHCELTVSTTSPPCCPFTMIL